MVVATKVINNDILGRGCSRRGGAYLSAEAAAALAGLRGARQHERAAIRLEHTTNGLAKYPLYVI